MSAQGERPGGMSAELVTQVLRASLEFLDRQMLLAPSVNEQIGFDFQGFRRSYEDDPAHPDARFVARFGRVWIYDVALSIYADLKSGRLRQAGYQVGRVMQLALREKERGFQGLWHFSYNSQGDLFIDARGPAGANAWCLNAVYAYILATGNTTPLAWANRAVQEFLSPLQVTEGQDPRFGLIRAGLFNSDDLARGDAMGYQVYGGDLNHRYEHVILEHNADAAGTFRLAHRATRRFSPEGSGSFLEELAHRHDLLMQGIRRSFWQGDHFISAVDPQGRPYLGTDGLPSIAVDNNTWAAHAFLPYDPDVAEAAIRYVEEKFLTCAPPAQIEDLPQAVALPELKGLYYFPATFMDPFVLVADGDRAKMEKLFSPEAALGFVLFLKDAGRQARAWELFEQTMQLTRLYGSGGAPYASANVPKIFTTLHSVTTAATCAIAAAVLKGESSDDFLGVLPPPEFSVAGKPPRTAVLTPTP